MLAPANIAAATLTIIRTSMSSDARASRPATGTRWRRANGRNRDGPPTAPAGTDSFAR